MPDQAPTPASPATSAPPPSSPTPAASATAPSPPAAKPSAPSTPGGSAGGGTQAAGIPPEKPADTDGTVALRLVREQRLRSGAEKARDEALGKLRAAEPHAATTASFRAKWAAKDYVGAMREAFGTADFSDDLLVALASGSEEPKPLTPEQMREQIRAQLEEERTAASAAETAQMQTLRMEAVKEVGSVLTASPEKWPTLWAVGVTGEQIAAALDASYDRATGRMAEATALFDGLEQALRAKLQGLPWVPKAPEPPAAPRSFLSSRGPTDAAPEVKPQTWAEREAARAERDRLFREKHFGGGAK